MSSEEWIEVIDRAIAIGEDFQVEDEGSHRTFNYDLEALHDIKTSLEAGATSDEIENQFEEFVQDDFARYVAVLAEALDGEDEQEEAPADHSASEAPTPIEQESAGVEVPTLSEAPPSAAGSDFDEVPAEDSGNNSSPAGMSSRKKGLIVTAGLSAFVLVILAGGFVGWKVYTTAFSTPPPQANNVQSVLKSKPKPAPSESQNPPSPAPASDSSSEAPAQKSGGFTVAQMEDSAESAPSAPVSPVKPAAMNRKPANGNSAPSIEETVISEREMKSIRKDIEERIAGLEDSVADQVGDQFGSLSDKLESLERRLQKLDELEQMLARQESEKNTRSAELKSKLTGLTRLGEFSILKTAGLESRVVALSPTNRVITLEEGEQNVLAAGSNLTVKEIVGDGQAVIFTEGWFIDEVRAPESLREQELTEQAAASSNIGDEPTVTGTARNADSPSPAMVAQNGSASRSSSSPNDSSSRFPTIERAPMGWEATALIPPRKAVIVDPDGDSFTITSGSQIAGLGKVHSVKQERVLVGQYYIPLSNF